MVVLLYLAVIDCADAQTQKYAVEIAAPADLQKLLQENLDIVRWSKREDTTPGQLAQLYKSAPDQIREILATEGYFSPHVSASRDRERSPETVRFVIEPGEPARISTIDLKISGPVADDPRESARIAEARAAFGMHPGDIFRQKQWSAAKDAVVQSLSHRVYGAAHVSSSK